VVPLAVRYEFLLEQAPDIFVRIGAPLRFDLERERVSSADVNARIEAAMTDLSDRLHDEVVKGDLQAYRRVLTGRGSINQTWGRVVSAVGRVRALFGKG
jgi:hypothetical protein